VISSAFPTEKPGFRTGLFFFLGARPAIGDGSILIARSKVLLYDHARKTWADNPKWLDLLNRMEEI